MEFHLWLVLNHHTRMLYENCPTRMGITCTHIQEWSLVTHETTIFSSFSNTFKRQWPELLLVNLCYWQASLE